MSIAIGNLLTRSSDTCGGRLRIEGTRITVHQVVTLYKKGESPEEIANQYLHLNLAQIHAAIAHYHANRKEIEASLTAEQTEAEALERQYLGIRESA